MPDKKSGKPSKSKQTVAKKTAAKAIKKVSKTSEAARKSSAKPATSKAAKKQASPKSQASKASTAPKMLPAAKKQLGKRPAFNAKLDSANDPNWQPPVWDDDVLLGAHVSAAGGSHEAPPRARAIGATAMQLFTKMANRWAERACEDAECQSFRAALADTRVRATMAHDSYLINLASPDETLRRRSIESFVAELARCEALGLTYLVSHPGNYIDERASGIQRNADGITEALSRVSGSTILCMEITAGSGTSIGSSFEDLAALIEGVAPEHRDRMGVCVDTCHAYSAGYDLVNAYEDVWKRFDDVVGMSRLKCMHLNDSKTPFNSKRDRHEVIAEGSLGEAAFRFVMNDARLAKVPKVIETPKGTDPTAMDTKMLTRLRSYISKQ
ncbi:MAG TPA: deoxyribonuclease IV [Gemmatimonadaceae bacterium]|jgi:deoxyribonuclease-4